MPSSVIERARNWMDRESKDSSLRWFRSVFGAVWALYDVCDLLGAGTATAAYWPSGIYRSSHHLELLQLGLIACETAMIGGVWPRAAPLGAAALRALEAYRYLRLNDFYYFIVVALLLSNVPAGSPWPSRRRARSRSWVRDAIRFQTAWIYLATGTLKLNTAWLSGGHLYVRQSYLESVAHWPYPSAVIPYLSDIRFDAGLAWISVLSEIALSVLIVLGGPGWAILGIAAAIHAYGALGTNVWFFGASMFAQVALVCRPGGLRAGPILSRMRFVRTPRRESRPRQKGPRKERVLPSTRA